MKQIIFILAIISSMATFGQQNPILLKQINYSCEDGTKQAQDDFANKNYTLTSYGLMIVEDWDFEAFYNDFVKRKYNIVLNNGGCIVDEAKLCYYSTMKDLLHKEFGDDIFKNARAEAKLLYDKQKQD